jgi:hypothetical protein
MNHNNYWLCQPVISIGVKRSGKKTLAFYPSALTFIKLSKGFSFVKPTSNSH